MFDKKITLLMTDNFCKNSSHILILLATFSYNFILQFPD